MNADDIPNRLDGHGSRPWKSDTCWNCRHLQVGTQRCTAFPEGIPEELWGAYRGHRKPFPGDHGLQFSERPLPSPLLASRYEVPDFLKKPEKP